MKDCPQTYIISKTEIYFSEQLAGDDKSLSEIHHLVGSKSGTSTVPVVSAWILWGCRWHIAIIACQLQIVSLAFWPIPWHPSYQLHVMYRVYPTLIINIITVSSCNAWQTWWWMRNFVRLEFLQMCSWDFSIIVMTLIEYNFQIENLLAKVCLLII